MRKDISSSNARKNESAFLLPRLIIAVTFVVAGLACGWFALAAPIAARGPVARPQETVRSKQIPITNAPTPSSGTISLATPSLTYSDGPFVVPNPTAQAGPPDCTVPMSCSDFVLTVGVTDPTKQVRISVSWPVSTADFDVYVYNGSPVTGTSTQAGSSASSSDPEIVILPATSGVYTIRTVPFAPAGQTYTAVVSLENKPAVPVAGNAPPPRYQDYPPTPADLAGAGSAGEPSVGVDWNPNVASLRNITPPTPSTPPVNGTLNGIRLNTAGVAFFTANLNEYRVNFDDCSSPAKNLWEDVTNATESITTLDPIGFVDHQLPGEPGTGAGLGRIFQSQLAGATSITSFSDLDGNAGSYSQSQGSGQPAGVDHQTIGGGPYAPTNLSAVPPVIEPPHTYPHQIYYASQDIGTSFAARSDDGGQTFNPGVPMYNISQCGGLHGHIKVGQDGTVYLPNKSCGGNTAVVVSRDNGLTWTVKPIPGSTSGSTDPSVGIGADNTLYVGYQNGDGHPHIAVSTDHGDHFHDVDVSQGLIEHSVFPEVVAGDGDRAAFGFLGTSATGNPDDINSFRGVWYFYIATTFDRGQTYTLVDASNGDPVQIGSVCTAGTTCGADRNLLDFNDIQLDKEGRVIAAHADGCLAPGCNAGTAAAHGPPYNESRGALSTIIRQSGGPRLLSANDSQAGCSGNGSATPSTLICTPIVPGAPRVDSVVLTGNTVHLEWSQPDNGNSPLTGYHVFRKIGTNGTYVLLATVAQNCPACKTSYDDTVANPTLQYFYKVTALNAAGESPACGEFPVGAAGLLESPCLPPGLTELTDPSGDNTPPSPGSDLLSFQLAQPFAPTGPIKLVFTINTDPGQNPQPAGSAWYVAMQITHQNATTDFKGVHMAYKADPSTPLVPPTSPTFEYYTPGANNSGGVDGRFVTAGSNHPADPSSSYAPPYNKIVIVVNASDLGLNPGDVINGFISGVAQSTDPTGGFVPASAVALIDQMPDSLTFSSRNGPYTLNGNQVCAPNLAPVAALLATPNQGDPPLVVQLDASGSSDPDAGDTIASYTFDFGDGSAPVTQASPIIQHTYQSNGDFKATVRVTDSRGLVSGNLATASIDVALPLNRVASRKSHNGAPGGPFEVILYDPAVIPNGTGQVECRAPGPENEYTIVYTFGSAFTVTGQATTVTLDSATTYVSSHGPGPAANQYTVHLNSSLPNAQNHQLVLNGVPVKNANKSNAPATLNNAQALLSLLVGDVDGSRRTDSGDVTAVRLNTVSIPTQSTFRFDVNASGRTDAGDVTLTRQSSITALPRASESGKKD